MVCLLEIRMFWIEFYLLPPHLFCPAVRITSLSYAWPHSDYEVEALSRLYGAQMTAAFLKFEDVVRGVLSTTHPARLLQLNRFATMGVTPSGETNGYQAVYRQEIRAAMNIHLTEETRLYTDASKPQVRPNITIACSPPIRAFSQSSIRSAIDVASALALEIRASQYFKDGNHRTCLLALALSLAEHGVVLTSSFHVYRAYTILSARFHPGNESNTLSAAARADTHRRIVRYLRQRTVRGVADAEYLLTLAETVRQLPIVVSHVEEVGARLRREREHRSRIWSSLNWAQKVVVKWTFPDMARMR